jgi:hypothetical protein
MDAALAFAAVGFRGSQAAGRYLRVEKLGQAPRGHHFLEE